MHALTLTLSPKRGNGSPHQLMTRKRPEVVPFYNLHQRRRRLVPLLGERAGVRACVVTYLLSISYFTNYPLNTLGINRFGGSSSAIWNCFGFRVSGFEILNAL